MISANVTRAAVLVSTIGLAGVFGFPPSAAQEAAPDVAHVAAVSGRVVALVRGTPSLLETADVISDRTRLDVLANSELQVCHYRMQRFVTMSGPARVTVSAGGISRIRQGGRYLQGNMRRPPSLKFPRWRGDAGRVVQAVTMTDIWLAPGGVIVQ